MVSLISRLHLDPSPSEFGSSDSSDGTVFRLRAGRLWVQIPAGVIELYLLRNDRPGSSVDIVTGYGLDGPGIEIPVGGTRFSAPVHTGPGAHPASCIMGTGFFPGVKSNRGVTLTPHPLLVPWSRKSRDVHLLPLWAVRPVQSLSACTRVHFTLPYLLPRVGPTQPPYLVGNPFPSGRKSGRGVKLCSCSAEFRNEWDCTSTPPIYIHGTDRDNIPFYFLVPEFYVRQ